jgi:Domain of unknown function (DUF4411)
VAGSIPRSVYCFDTSGMIDGIERFYPIKNFPALWDKVDDLIEEGRLFVSEEAWNEFDDADAVFGAQCRTRSGPM